MKRRYRGTAKSASAAAHPLEKMEIKSARRIPSTAIYDSAMAVKCGVSVSLDQLIAFGRFEIYPNHLCD